MEILAQPECGLFRTYPVHTYFMVSKVACFPAQSVDFREFTGIAMSSACVMLATLGFAPCWAAKGNQAFSIHAKAIIGNHQETVSQLGRRGGKKIDSNCRLHSLHYFGETVLYRIPYQFGQCIFDSFECILAGKNICGRREVQRVRDYISSEHIPGRNIFPEKVRLYKIIICLCRERDVSVLLAIIHNTKVGRWPWVPQKVVFFHLILVMVIQN